jgi:hypothetical protein
MARMGIAGANPAIAWLRKKQPPAAAAELRIRSYQVLGPKAAD